jgi:hypothetical protein
MKLAAIDSEASWSSGTSLTNFEKIKILSSSTMILLKSKNTLGIPFSHCAQGCSPAVLSFLPQRGIAIAL